MTALGYLLLGVVIGLGLACTVCVAGAIQRQSKEQAIRDESWSSIRGALSASERHALEVANVSRGA